jgi:hypothetical protein
LIDRSARGRIRCAAQPEIICAEASIRLPAGHASHIARTSRDAFSNEHPPSGYASVHEISLTSIKQSPVGAAAPEEYAELPHFGYRNSIESVGIGGQGMAASKIDKEGAIPPSSLSFRLKELRCARSILDLNQGFPK